MKKSTKAENREAVEYAKFLFHNTFGYGGDRFGNTDNWRLRGTVKRHKGKDYVILRADQNRMSGVQIYRMRKRFLDEVHDRDLEYALVPSEKRRREKTPC